jgi:hypothetical protein
VHFILIQTIGFIAVGCTFALYQFNSRKHMLYIGLCGAALYSVHFTLLGARTGAVMNGLSFIRMLTFLQYGTRKRPAWIMYGFIIAFIVAGLLSWQGWYSVLPIIGMCSGTVAFWQLKPSRIRVLSLIAPPCWFIYNFIVGSYAGMTAEIVNVSSNSFAIWRFDMKKQVPAKKPKLTHSTIGR